MTTKIGKPMPRPTQYANQDASKPGGRIEVLLRVRWAGNQRDMARDLGVSQALISKVVRGERTPGPKLLNAAANASGVNPQYVHEGRGEPLRAGRPRGPGR